MNVLVVGGANYDLVAHAGRLPGEGETLVADDFHGAPGGKAANLACAAARWGAHTRFVGRVGDDDFGRAVRDDLVAAGCDVRHLATDARGTGLGLVFMDGDGRYATVVAPRANAGLSADDVAELPDAWFTPDAVIALALEAPLDALHAVTERARDVGATVVLNAAPVDRLDDALDARWTVLVVNEHEAGERLGRPVDEGSAADAARTLAGGERTAVVTLGAAGAVGWSPTHGPLHVAGLPVHAVDTLGAGDVFTGVLAAETAAGRPLDAAITTATRVASASVTRPGARFPEGTPNGVADILTPSPHPTLQEDPA
ncbi:MAG: ribokinase [Trueperaceae bacterium]|nr:ribokinase [Trueperaceae bacterium]